MSEIAIPQENTLKVISRNQYGLINEGVKYLFDSNGRVDWRKMLKEEFLVPNNSVTKETDITKLNDNELLILLSGVKYLADLRGFNSVTYKVVKAEPGYCCAVCTISWIPNYESEFRTIIFESTADASTDNTVGFGQYYLAAMAENRAFARCVRNFLRINIVAENEIDESVKIENEKSKKAGKRQLKVLENLMGEKGISFEIIKERLTKDSKWEEEYKTLQDIPKDIVFDLIARLKKYEPVETT